MLTGRTSPGPSGRASSAVAVTASRCGREVLHREGQLAGRLLRRRPSPGSPASGRAARRAGSTMSCATAPPRRQRLLVEADALELDARGAADHQRPLAVLHRPGLAVAHQADQLHRLAGPIDAAVGIEIAVDRRLASRPPIGDLPAGRPPTPWLGQVHRRAVEVEGGEVRLRRHRPSACAGARPSSPCIRRRAKRTRPCASVRALARSSPSRGDQGHPHAGQRLGGLQRPHHHVERRPSPSRRSAPCR